MQRSSVALCDLGNIPALSWLYSLGSECYSDPKSDPKCDTKLLNPGSIGSNREKRIRPRCPEGRDQRREQGDSHEH